jgi:hypothetical protein
MLGITATVGVVAANRDIALMIEQSVKDMQGFARRRRNHFRVEWGIAIGEVRVEFASGVVAVMGVDAAGGSATRRAHRDASDGTRSAARLDRAAQTARQLNRKLADSPQAAATTSVGASSQSV